jgi:hypothetical protein
MFRLKQRFGGRSRVRHARPRRPRSFRASLEAIEDRTLLSTLSAINRLAAPAVEGLERPVSLSGFGRHSSGAVPGHGPAYSADFEVGGGLFNPGILFNHNETLVRDGTPWRRRKGAKQRRASRIRRRPPIDPL